MLYDHEGAPCVDLLHPHRLSTFFIALSLGAHYEQESAVGESDSETYNLLALAALSLSSIIHEVTCSALQALFLIIQYHYFTDPGTDETRWLLFGALCRAAQIVSGHIPSSSSPIQSDSWMPTTASPPLSLDRSSYVFIFVNTSRAIYLISFILFCSLSEPPVAHALLIRSERDSAPWNLDPQEVQRRRTLFWEMYTWDSWAVSSILAWSSFVIFAAASFWKPFWCSTVRLWKIRDQLIVLLFGLMLFVLAWDDLPRSSLVTLACLDHRVSSTLVPVPSG